jgi:hypothetical protein
MREDAVGAVREADPGARHPAGLDPDPAAGSVDRDAADVLPRQPFSAPKPEMMTTTAMT